MLRYVLQVFDTCANDITESVTQIVNLRGMNKNCESKNQCKCVVFE